MEEKSYINRKERAFKCKNFEQVAINCNHLGNLYNQQGQYKKALQEFQEECAAYSKLGKKLELAKAHRMIGEMQILLCNLDEALKHIEIFLDTVKRLQHKVEEQRAFVTLGRVYLLLSQSKSECASELLDKSEKSFVKSLQLATELSGQITKIEQYDMQARSNLNIGIVKENSGDFESALLFLKEAINISTKNDLFEISHLCYVSMSQLYADKLKDFPQALLYCNKGLETAKRLPMKVKKICETLIIKSDILIKEGDFSSAKQILTKAYKKNTPDEHDQKCIEKSLRIVLKICQAQDQLISIDALDFANRKRLFEILGDACCSLQSYEQALEYYHNMLENANRINESPENLIPIYVSLYQTYKDTKQYEKALEYMWKEFELVQNEPKEACATLCEIAEIYEIQSQSFWATFDILGKAKEQVIKSHDKSLTRKIYQRLYAYLLKNNKNQLVKELNKEAVELEITLTLENDESESDSECEDKENKSDVSEEFDLEELSDSGASDLDEVATPALVRHRNRNRSLTVKRNNKGETSLHQACIAGNFELVSHLISQGHTVNIRDHAGWLPLHEACNHGYTNIVQLLLDRGAAVAINDKGGTSCDGITPLYDACSNGFLDTIALLLERGADPTLKTDFGDTCLNALDKWRSSANLNLSEIKQYETIRQALFEPLHKAGISKNKYSSKLNSDNTVVGLIHNTDSSDDGEHLSESDDQDSLLLSSQNPLANTFITTERTNSTLQGQSLIKQMKHPNRRLLSLSRHQGTSRREFNAVAAKTTSCSESDDMFIANMHMNKKSRHNQQDINKPGNQSCNTNSIRNDLDATPVRQQSKAEDSYTNKVTGKTVKEFSAHLTDASILESSPMHTPKETTAGSVSSLSRNTISHIAMHGAPLLVTTISFKIKVEDELLLVPIERNKIEQFTIRCLAEEVAVRYYNIVGMKPILRLKTGDGFTYDDNDAVTVALDQNVLLATVLSWELKSLEENYVYVCNKLNKGKSDKVFTKMIQSEITHGLNLSGFWLKSYELEPVFKTISFPNKLRVLDFSNNLMRDEGCQQLLKCLEALTQLQRLNLRGNFITVQGIEKLLDAICAKELNLLSELNISQNPLRNQSIDCLEQFFGKASSLRKVSISDCCLTELPNSFDCFSKLKALDISFNQFSVSSLLKLFDKLEIPQMELLNLSGIYPTFLCDYNQRCIREVFTKFFERNSCEHLIHLNISGWSLSDSSLRVMAKCLKEVSYLKGFEVDDKEW